MPQRVYTGLGGSVTRYFNLKLPIAWGRTSTFVYVDPGNGTATELRHWGQTHEHVWAGMRKRGITIHVAAIGVNPEADRRGRTVLNGWAREQKRVQAGSPREVKLQEELDELSRALGNSNSEIFARYRGYDNTVERYYELKDMLAKPAPYNIRVDTFEIWRSERIFPDGTQIYEAPA